MAIAIYVLAALVILHYVYEGILAPSFRLQIRYQLFAVRDEIRRLDGACAEGDAFLYLNKSVNNAIRVLPFFDVAAIVDVRRDVSEDRSLKAESEEALQVIASDATASALFQRVGRLLLRAIFVNSLLFVLPFFFYSKVRKFTLMALVLPGKYLQKFDPAPELNEPTPTGIGTAT